MFMIERQGSFASAILIIRTRTDGRVLRFLHGKTEDHTGRGRHPRARPRPGFQAGRARGSPVDCLVTQLDADFSAHAIDGRQSSVDRPGHVVARHRSFVASNEPYEAPRIRMSRAMRPPTDDVFRRATTPAQICERLLLRQELSRICGAIPSSLGVQPQGMPAEFEATGQADAARLKGVASSSNALKMSRMLMTPIRL